jgi:phage major head subunit gpT-like protein
MLINAPNMALLRRTFNKSFQDAFDATPSWTSRVATKVSAPTGVNVYGWVSKAMIRRWRGERRKQALQEHEAIIKSEKYEGTVTVDRDKIIRDNLGIYTTDFHGLGNAAKKHPDLLLARMLRRGTFTCYDGKELFATDHLTYNTESPSFSNDFLLDLNSGIVTDGTNSDTFTGDREAMIGNALAWVRARMAQTPVESSTEKTDSAGSAHDDDEDDDVLGVDLNQIITPIGWDFDIRKVVNSSIVPTASGSGVDNSPLKGMFSDIVTAPELKGNAIYLLDSSKPVKALIHQVTAEPVLRMFDTSEEFAAFMTGDFTYGIDGSDGGSFSETVCPSHPFLIARLQIVPET